MLRKEIEYLQSRSLTQHGFVNLMTTLYNYVREDGQFSVSKYGATGNGFSDDTKPIQQAIDDAAKSGAPVFFPGGDYRCNVVLKTGVSLIAPYPIHVPWESRGVRLMPVTEAPVIDTPATRISGCGISGLAFHGKGAAIPGQAVRFRNARGGFVRDFTINNFADEAIEFGSQSIACFIQRGFIQNALLNRTRNEVHGAIDLGGTDHWVDNVEATASMNAYNSGNIAAFLVRSANSEFSGCVGEISEVGFHFGPAAFYNRLVNCRADLNYGDGYRVQGDQNSFSACHGTRNSQGSDGAYSGFSVTGRNNVFSGCIAGSLFVDARKQQYGYADAGIENEFAACSGRFNKTTLFAGRN